MKKLLLSAAMCAGLVGLARAGIIFNWALDDVSYESLTYTKAKISADSGDGNGYQYLYYADNSSGAWTQGTTASTLDSDNDPAQAFFVGDSTAFKSSSFQVTLYGGTSDGWMSDVLSGEWIWNNYGNAVLELDSSREAEAPSETVTFSVPEPTSGLLVLLGAALLGLKRKVA